MRSEFRDTSKTTDAGKGREPAVRKSFSAIDEMNLVRSLETKKAINHANVLAERRMGDNDISARAITVFQSLRRARQRAVDFEASIGSFLAKGSHPEYVGYSGEDLKALVAAVKQLEK